MNQELTPQQQAEFFGQDWDPEYHHEARQRWGNTPEWEQSQQRAARYTRDDWQRVKAAGDALEGRLARAQQEGVLPGSELANALAEEHRAMIGQFYDCTHSMHVCLGTMYTQDPRFREHYDALSPGLASWLSDVIAENARGHGVDPGNAVWR